METTPLGRTGESVSQLPLGTIYFGSEIDRETSYAILDTYYEAGGRFLDTANNYATWLEGYDEPRSEYVLGDWLEDRGVREEMTVATKVGFNPPDLPRSLDPELVSESVAESRERMDLETIDLLYAHVDDPDTPQEELLETFGDLRNEGHVRYFGASNFPAWRVARANRIAERRDLPRFDCVQPRLSYLIPDRDAKFGGQLQATDELIDYCERANLAVVPYSPTLGGAYGREDRPIPEGYVRTENRLKLRAIEAVADRTGEDANAVALAWLVESGYAPIIGCSTVEQLEANLAATEIEFTESERQRLAGIESYGFSGWELRE